MIVIISSTFISSAQSIKQDHLVFAWKNMKNMVVNSAKAMPEEHYNFIPAKGLKNFTNQVKHISVTNRYFIGYIIEDIDNYAIYETINIVKGKEAIIRDLEESFDFVIETLSKIRDFDESINMMNQILSKAEVFILAQEYLQRQQGKIAIYLRMNGISPAKSTSWLL